jgi:hypothetical protein
MSEARLTEVTLSNSAGGKIQIIKFDEASDYHVSETRKFSIPEDWTDDQVDEFLIVQREELRTHVDTLAQRERDERAEQSSCI